MITSTTRKLCTATALVIGSAALLGCPDTEGEYQAFQERYNAIHPSSSSGTGGGCAAIPAAGEADGHFLFALAAVLYPPTPLLFETELVTTDGPNGLELTMNDQPLSGSDRVTPVGEPFNIGGPYPVAADGSFVAELPPLFVSGEANTITPGADIVANVTLKGTLCAPADFICGTVDGVTTEPPNIDLNGSTFTMERLDSAGPPYPEPPKIDCAGTLAQPI